MSRFASDFVDAGLGDLYEELGEAAVYTPLAGRAAPITVIVASLASQEEDRGDGKVIVHRLAVKLRTSEVANPGRGDRLAVRGFDDWGFEARSALAGQWACQFVRTEPVSKTRRGREYR